MTSADDVPLTWVPDACTLPTAERPLRQAEFDELFATAVRNSERVNQTHLRFTLAGPEDLRARVEDLAARERECCSFFAFSVTTPAAGSVLFDIEVPAAYREVLDALADRAITIAKGLR